MAEWKNASRDDLLHDLAQMADLLQRPPRPRAVYLTPREAELCREECSDPNAFDRDVVFGNIVVLSDDQVDPIEPEEQ